MKYTTEIVADNLIMLSKNETGTNPQPNYPPTIEQKDIPPIDMKDDPSDVLPF